MVDETWQKVKDSALPLGTATRHPSPSKPTPASIKPKARLPVAPAPAKSAPINLSQAKGGGISDKDRKRIKTGDIHLAARLDLHGLTTVEAEKQLTSFLEASYTSQHGHVLVITGKGSHNQQGSGILRQMLPKWLARKRLADKVVAFAPATPQHGGGGAWYIKIRRHRHQQ